MKILIVEDEKTLADSIVEYQQQEGYLCERAPKLSKADEKINLYLYDCIIVDIGLPDGSVVGRGSYPEGKEKRKRHYYNISKEFSI